MSTREDWDKGDDLTTMVEPDFVLVNELGVDELIMSIGWDDFEPSQGNYDFAWLHDFASLADTYGIKLRPYICYTPEWAGNGEWNSPPTDYQDWYNFCYALGTAMSTHSNIVSYEIWNEWNDELWWSGTFTEYVQLLTTGSSALKATDTDADIIMGGLVYPHWEAIDACTQGTVEESYEIVPFHCYREWYGTRDSLESYLDAQYTDWFVPTVNENGEGESIWCNEVGFSTLDRGEEAQRSYFARAVPYLFASDASLGEIDHFDAYEIKDLGPDAPVIGPDDIRYLGLCDEYRTKKLAFPTVAMWVSLLDDRTITTPVNADVTLEATSGRFGDEYYYLIYRDEGGGATSQILVIYDKRNTLTCEATLTIPGTTCTKWNIDGTSEDFTANLNGTIISNIPVTEDDVTILEVMP
ncbi:MAG: beta-galactosidase [Armatimonadota bacterium]|nr:MAG: beta-galactosidase [Armatimonadota bacterium]